MKHFRKLSLAIVMVFPQISDVWKYHLAALLVSLWLSARKILTFICNTDKIEIS